MTPTDYASSIRRHDAPGETDWVAAERTFDERCECSETGLGAEGTQGPEVASANGTAVETAGPAATR